MSIPIHPMPAMPLIGEPPPWNGERGIIGHCQQGRSVLGNAINLYGYRKSNLLVMAGVHGDESEGIFLAHLLLSAGCPVPLLPCVNPDGALLRQRWNANNVDLNRNLPTRDWKPEAINPRYPPGAQPASEPETAAFLTTLKQVGAKVVLSLHSYKESFVEIERAPETLPEHVNAAVDDFTTLAEIERRLAIGYPTPGAMGSFGLENGLLVLTYELRRGLSHGEIQQNLFPGFLNLIQALDAAPFSAPPEEARHH